MKRVILLLALAVLLSGCGSAAAGTSHPDWDASWTRVGDVLALEPIEGFTAGENKDLLAGSGLWYVSWIAGEARTVVNAEGEEAEAYDAQLFVLLRECKDGESAQKSVEEWLEREAQTYRTEAAQTAEYGDQSWQRLPLLEGRSGNPYSHGTAAFAARGVYAVSVELLCSAESYLEPEAVMDAVLNGIHYAQ